MLPLGTLFFFHIFDPRLVQSVNAEPADMEGQLYLRMYVHVYVYPPSYTVPAFAFHEAHAGFSLLSIPVIPSFICQLLFH